MNILDNYNEPQRLYHNTEHIAHMRRTALTLLVAEGVLLTPSEKTSLDTAITYHDLFLGPEHETASATQCLAITGDVLACDLIITGTTHFGDAYAAHKRWKELLNVPDVDINIFQLTALRQIIHDADLWTLGCDAVDYDRYQLKVIAENLALQNNVQTVFNGRLKFLDWVIARVEGNTLFYTNEGKKLHFKVHANATREKSKLLKFLDASSMGG